MRAATRLEVDHPPPGKPGPSPGSPEPEAVADSFLGKDVEVNENIEEGVIIRFQHESGLQGLRFDPQPPTLTHAGNSVEVLEDGNIKVDFRIELETRQILIFEPPQGLNFTGFVAGPIARRASGASRIWRGPGSVELTPFKVLVLESQELSLEIAFETGTFFYYLLYEVDGEEFICDPEITNDGDIGG